MESSVVNSSSLDKHAYVADAFLCPVTMTDLLYYDIRDDIFVTSPVPSGFGILNADDRDLLDFDDVFDLQSTISYSPITPPPPPTTTTSTSGTRICAPVPSIVPCVAPCQPQQKQKNSRRRARDTIRSQVIDADFIEMSLAQNCPCATRSGGQSCLRHFDTSTVWGLRQERWKKYGKDDSHLRHTEITAGLEVDKH
jgi:hypothetical protein